LWTYINGRRDQYLNSFYGRHTVENNTQPPYDFSCQQSDDDESDDPPEENNSDFKVVLNPDCNIETLAMHFWAGYFTRHSTSAKSKYQVLIRNALIRLEKENKKNETKIFT